MTDRRARYITSGKGEGWRKACEYLGYKPLKNPPKEGKRKEITRKDAFQNERVTIEVTEIHHEH